MAEPRSNEGLPDEGARGSHLKIHWAPAQSIVIHSVSEDELQRLEAGEPASVYLTFAVFCLSSFLSLLAALLVAKFDDAPAAFTVFVCLTIGTGLGGAVLLTLWIRTRRSGSMVLRDIRERQLGPPDDRPPEE